jgi:hypothetical protein
VLALPGLASYQNLNLVARPSASARATRAALVRKRSVKVVRSRRDDDDGQRATGNSICVTPTTGPSAPAVQCPSDAEPKPTRAADRAGLLDHRRGYLANIQVSSPEEKLILVDWNFKSVPRRVKPPFRSQIVELFEC